LMVSKYCEKSTNNKMSKGNFAAHAAKI